MNPHPFLWYEIAAPILACVVMTGLAAAGYTRFRFAFLGMLGLVTYGILQNQVSARLCPEYFTQFHKPIPDVTDPTLLAVCWGFLASWWGGTLFGYVAGLVATLGPRPPLTTRDFVRPLLVYLVALTTVVAISGVSVWINSTNLGVSIDPSFTWQFPAVSRHKNLLIVATYHMVAYATATVGGVIVCVWLGRERVRRAGQVTQKDFEMSKPQGSPAMEGSIT
jgi:hypothetical protein